MNKKEFRKKVKIIRDSISAKDRNDKSLLACENLFKISALNKDFNSKNIMVFLNFETEISTGNIINEFRNRDCRIFVPKISSLENRTMEVIEYKESDILEKNNYGIREPISNISINPQELDVIILPGLAFDKSLNRLGYGGGFYDKILEKVCGNCIKVGLCFEEQIFDEIPFEEHDKRMDFVVSDKRVIG